MTPPMSEPDDPRRHVGRRTLLAGTVGALTLATSCGSPKPVTPPRPRITTAALTSEVPFYIAHRGGGDNWPELTAYAYEQAAKIPSIRALEISVCRSADGVLVCSHDPVTTRMTGLRYVIADTSWDRLSSLMVTAQETNDPEQPDRPFTRFDDVVDRYIDDFVLFVEPKVPAAVDDLMAKMVSLRQPERVVWKQPINQRNFATAKQRGFATWGYVLDESGHLGDNLRRYAASPAIDMLGVARSQRESVIELVSMTALAHGKKTIIWPIRNVDDRARGLRLGCHGMMTSNVVDVPDAPL